MMHDCVFSCINLCVHITIEDIDLVTDEWINARAVYMIKLDTTRTPTSIYYDTFPDFLGYKER